jgi:plasmid stabilization system protein ParE
MRVVQFLAAASEELEAAASYYENHQSGLGHQLIAEARKTRDRIVALPNAAPEIRSGIRRRTIHRFPYHIIYRVTDDQILVIAVAHKRRRPDYWLGRM